MDIAIAGWTITDDINGDPLLKPIVFHPEPLSLDEATRQLPEGAYTTFRTYRRFQIVNLTDHINRLEETARLADHPLSLNRAALKKALHIAFMAFPSDQKRVRVILDLTRDVGSLYILIEKLVVPSKEEYENGVAIITRRLQRNNPKAKLTDFIKTAEDVRQELPPGVHEVIMLDEHQQVLEGLSSNFFAIKSGVIWTANEGILAGITRQTVLNIIQAQGIPIKFAGINVDEISDLDEAFLTSTSRAILPVREIDGLLIGDGHPGKITRSIMTAYRAEIEHHLEVV